MSNDKYLKQQALKFLCNSESYPGMIRRKTDEIQLIIWSDYSLGYHTTWTLFETEKEDYLRKVIWDKRVIYNLRDPETYCAEVLISKNTSSRIISALTQKLEIEKIKEIAPPLIQIDGSNHGFVFQGRKFEWWNELPLANIEIFRWYKNTISEFDKLFQS